MMWEYLVISMSEDSKSWTAENITKFLNEQGAKGWECFNTTGYGVFYFKREVFGWFVGDVS